MTSDLYAAFNMCQWWGLFVPKNRWQIMYRGYQAAVITVVGAVTISMTIQLFVAPDLTMLARTIDLWTMCWTGLYKWCAMATFSERFQEFRTLAAIIRKQSTAVYGPWAHQFTVAYQRKMNIISYAYVFSGFPVVVLLSVGPLMTYQQGDKSDMEYFNDPRSYPLCCWMPFIVSNYWTFLILCIMQFLTILYTLIMYLINDTYMFGALYIMGGQIELIKMSFQNIARSIEHDDRQSESSENEMLINEPKRSTMCYSMLTECVKHHNLILNYIRTLRIMFSTLILVDYLHAIISLTFAIFQTTTSIGFGEGISVFSFIVISLYHQFLNHFFGEYIIQKQLSVRDAAFDFPWFRMDKKSRQLLTIVICRTNHPLIMSGLYMYRLCYQSLITFLKTLYSYYMVLRNVNT